MEERGIVLVGLTFRRYETRTLFSSTFLELPDIVLIHQNAIILRGGQQRSFRSNRLINPSVLLLHFPRIVVSTRTHLTPQAYLSTSCVLHQRLGLILQTEEEENRSARSCTPFLLLLRSR